MVLMAAYSDPVFFPEMVKSILFLAWEPRNPLKGLIKNPNVEFVKRNSLGSRTAKTSNFSSIASHSGDRP